MTASTASRTIVDLWNAPWTPMGEAFARRGGRGEAAIKLLEAPDGRRVGLVHLNGEGMPHAHTRASSFFILKGSMTLRDRVVGPGTWGIEPYGAIHPNTRFHDVVYGFGIAEGDFGVGNVILPDAREPPEWAVAAGFRQDDFATLVDTNGLVWIPFGPGLAFRVLHVLEGRGAFASMLRAEAGALLPRRRYLGPADMYVLKGRVEFEDGEQAAAGHWVHHAAGTEDGRTRFPVATTLLVNAYGPIIEFAADGAARRVVDGFALRDLAAVRTDGGPTVESLGPTAIRAALARVAAASSARRAS